MKKVSIIVPLYKSEKYLDKLLGSILSQTYVDLEIILIDDGSPDRSGEIADGYAEKDSRIIVIHQDNRGTCTARNRGLELATGSYLMFADGDDWLEKDCVEYLVSLLEINDVDMSMSDSIFTTRDRNQNAADNVRVWTSEQAVAGIINTFIIPVGPWNKLYKMEIIRNNNISFSVPWFGEGLYFSVMAAQASSMVAVGHRKVYNYRLNNPNSGCTQREVKNGFAALNNILYIKDRIHYRTSEIEEAFDWHILMNHYNLITCIVGAKAEADYYEDLKNSIKEIRRLRSKVMKHSLLSTKQKLIITLKTMFPVYFAKRGIKKSHKKFIADKMN